MQTTTLISGTMAVFRRGLSSQQYISLPGSLVTVCMGSLLLALLTKSTVRAPAFCFQDHNSTASRRIGSYFANDWTLSSPLPARKFRHRNFMAFAERTKSLYRPFTSFSLDLQGRPTMFFAAQTVSFGQQVKPTQIPGSGQGSMFGDLLPKLISRLSASGAQIQEPWVRMNLRPACPLFWCRAVFHSAPR